MIECPNLGVRDRLPDLANDTLEPAVRELVLIHLAECAACTAEIEILRTTRLILIGTTPKVNVAGIVSALPQYGVASITAAPSSRARSWATSWRMAAAMAFLAAGLGGYAVLRDDSPVRSIDSAQLAAATSDATVGLALTGALADMSDAELTELASDIETIEALPSTEVEMMDSPMASPTILPDSVVPEMEVR
jgi:hypothetical protein